MLSGASFARSSRNTLPAPYTDALVDWCQNNDVRDRVAVVVAHHVAAVGLHRVGARALMQYRNEIVVEVAVGEPHEELLLVHVIGDIAVDEIAELVGAREIVDGDDALLAARVQRLDEIGADEPGGAGDG